MSSASTDLNSSGQNAESHSPAVHSSALPPTPTGGRVLAPIFSPRSIALVGATERAGSVGRTVMLNLMEGRFPGEIVPVNGRSGSVFGKQSYAKVSDIPGRIDLVVIATPAATVPDVISDCGAAGIPGAIVLSAGFRETGPSGQELEQEVLRRARAAEIQLIGPNCLGVMNPHAGLNATFAASMAKPGSIAFLSQSGALCTAVLDWSLKMNVGFSAFVSVGSMVDVGWADLLDHFHDDPRTRSILMYMETIGDARSFLSAAREVAMTKPIIVIKAGRTPEAAKAAASHTGAMAGADEALDAAFRRAGVLRVDTIAELFYMAAILERQVVPRGPCLAVITNAGGPGVLATDGLIRNGGTLASLLPETIQTLDGHMPAAWSHGNPVDVLGDASPERYAVALEATAADKNVDGMLVVLTPQAMTDPTATAERLAQVSRSYSKPVLASWMGGEIVARGEAILRHAGIPTFPYPDTAARMFAYMYQHGQNLQALYETPNLCHGGECAPSDPAIATMLQEANAEGRTLLNEVESKAILAAYNIPTVAARAACSEEDAVQTARQIGHPVVLKLLSNKLAHKTDVGGVRLDLEGDHEVRDAYRAIRSSAIAAGGEEAFQGVSVQRMIHAKGYELILGSYVDAQLGPLILFGTGGVMAEVIGDRFLELPPLTTTLARRMIENTRAIKALRKPRHGAPVDLDTLAAVLVRFSQLVVRHPRIKEIDINPLVAGGDGITALDARVILYSSDVKDKSLPSPAIRPYPEQYTSGWKISDGPAVTFRPMRPEDEPLIVEFHKTLSERTVYRRYFHLAGLGQRTAHARLTKNVFLDYDRDMALVAEISDVSDHGSGNRRIIAVGRLIGPRHGGATVFTLVVSDDYQGRGVGRELMGRLLDVARAEGIRKIRGIILEQNGPMANLCRQLGFRLSHDSGDETITAELDLDAPVLS